ncbi:hypothetical protein ACLB0R_06960 [Sphingomonas sp. GlSt437]|uniref:hypothetical protein n=1 Tax=Sphingomonas sp. GlSt437 TaxID=3389970 RepID=UPI003A8658CA
MTASTDPLFDTIDLAAGVHAVGLTDGIVILDVNSDAYYCVYEPGRSEQGGAPPNPALRCANG